MYGHVETHGGASLRGYTCVEFVIPAQAGIHFSELGVNGCV
jgi:hypothetical protein